jgi:hypothetical protein
MTSHKQQVVESTGTPWSLFRHAEWKNPNGKFIIVEGVNKR